MRSPYRRRAGLAKHRYEYHVGDVAKFCKKKATGTRGDLGEVVGTELIPCSPAEEAGALKRWAQERRRERRQPGHAETLGRRPGSHKVSGDSRGDDGRALSVTPWRAGNPHSHARGPSSAEPRGLVRLVQVSSELGSSRPPETPGSLGSRGLDQRACASSNPGVSDGGWEAALRRREARQGARQPSTLSTVLRVVLVNHALVFWRQHATHLVQVVDRRWGRG
jgi:hypothetical protein